MAVKHLNFAGKQSLGKKVPQAKKIARQPKQFNTSTLAKGVAGAVAGGARQVVAKRAVSNIANSTAQAATAGVMKPIAKKTLSNFAKRTAQASTAGVKKIGKVRGH